jgi:hypothetical protein
MLEGYRTARKDYYDEALRRAQTEDLTRRLAMSKEAHAQAMARGMLGLSAARKGVARLGKDGAYADALRAIKLEEAKLGLDGKKLDLQHRPEKYAQDAQRAADAHALSGAQLKDYDARSRLTEGKAAALADDSRPDITGSGMLDGHGADPLGEALGRGAERKGVDPYGAFHADEAARPELGDASAEDELADALDRETAAREAAAPRPTIDDLYRDLDSGKLAAEGQAMADEAAAEDAHQRFGDRMF